MGNEVPSSRYNDSADPGWPFTFDRGQLYFFSRRFGTRHLTFKVCSSRPRQVWSPVVFGYMSGSPLSHEAGQAKIYAFVLPILFLGSRTFTCVDQRPGPGGVLSQMEARQSSFQGWHFPLSGSARRRGLAIPVPYLCQSMPHRLLFFFYGFVIVISFAGFHPPPPWQLQMYFRFALRPTPRSEIGVF